MGCCGGRDKEYVKPAQKWDYINLNDFRSSSCFTPFSYAFLWIMLGVSIACYVADFSTMINLLLWDKYGSNSFAPPVIFGSTALPRWVFTGCIILSYVLLVYRWMKAVRAMKSGGVAKNYLDPLAVRIQSIRPGRYGQGYRRFLVFAELTKSKHGTEYIALFVYFAFEAWLRILLAEAPRNAINAYTIYSLCVQWADQKNSPDQNKGDSGIQKFWAAVMQTANENHLRAAVFIGMVFTIVIWVIAFIGLVVAFILYALFLWHHIPSQDGGLRGYCKRKVDKSVEKIVSAKIKKALEDEQKTATKKSGKSGKSGKSDKMGLEPPPGDIKRQPTLPVLMDEEAGQLPPFAARPGTPSSMMTDRAPTVPSIPGGNNFSRPGPPLRTGTGLTNSSYGSNAPLLGEAAEMGQAEPGRPYSPAPGRPYSPAGGRSASPAPPPRPFTPTGELIMDRAASPAPQRSFTPASNAPSRSFTPASGNAPMPPFAPSARTPGPPSRQNTGFSDMNGGRASPAPGQPRQLTPANGSMGPRPPMGPQGPPPGMVRMGSALSAPVNGRGTPMQQPPPPVRANTAGPYGMQGRQSPAQFSRPDSFGQRSSGGRSTPVQEYEMQPQTRAGISVQAPKAEGGSYQAYRPGGVQSPATPSSSGILSPQTPASATHRLLSPPQPAMDPHSSTYGESILDDYAYSDGDDGRSQHHGPSGQGGNPHSRW